MKKIQNIYDNEKFYSEYSSMRDTELNANNLIEIPIMKTLLPDLKNKTILDLGCGNGAMSKFFIEKGAKRVVALDISKNMINEAKEKNYSEHIEYSIMAMEDISKLNEKFDIVFSSLAFHYVKDFKKLIADIYNLLVPNGILLYSQENPIATAPILEKDTPKYIQTDTKRYYLVSDYSNNGERKWFWNVDGVIKYHRSYTYIINTLIETKFSLLKLEDSYADERAIKLVEKYKYQSDRPYFLFVKAKKECR